MWKVSKYNVCVPKEDDVIVFNTFTSSLIILEKEIYQSVFIEQCFDNVDSDEDIKNELMVIALTFSALRFCCLQRNAFPTQINQ